jgi:drug/metabolite transporter (DMT)-like permease
MTLTKAVSAILAAIAGVALVTGAHHDGNTARLLGDGLVVLGTLFAALYVIISGRLVSHVPPVALATLQQSVGSVFALVLLVAWLPLAAASGSLSGYRNIGGCRMV